MMDAANRIKQNGDQVALRVHTAKADHTLQNVWQIEYTYQPVNKIS